MTETQARTRLQKLLTITQDRGAASGEQANATRAIGALLQEHPDLRDMITGVEGLPASSVDASPYAFWKGVLLGVGSVVLTLGIMVLSSVLGRGSNSSE